jgi:hypothetical protein
LKRSENPNVHKMFEEVEEKKRMKKGMEVGRRGNRCLF